MKRHYLFLAAVLVLIPCLLCSCTKKSSEPQKDTFNGDAVSGKKDNIEVLEEGEEGWEDYRKEAEKKVKTDGSKAAGDAFVRASEEQVVAIVNEKRAASGLKALTIDEAMMAGAEIRAQEQKIAFSHTRPDGRTCDTVFDDLGIPLLIFGENLGMGGDGRPAAIVDSWMNSAGHRANIMDGEFGRIGVGCFVSGGCTYWAQIFAN